MEFIDLQVHEKEMDSVKSLFSFIIPSFEDGACFFVTDLEKVNYKLTNKFDIPGITEGQKFSSSGVAAQAIQARKAITIHIPKNVYGTRTYGFASPIWNDSNTEITGAWVLALPRVHKLVAAFDSFAPVLADILPEGGVMLVADKEKFLKKQASQKFDIPAVQINTPLSNDSLQMKSIKQRKQLSEELDASRHGVPVLVVSSPVIDEETNEEVGTFSIALPRQLAKDLKEIAGALDQGLSGVSAAAQQIAAATNDAGTNQTQLNDEINTVKAQLENINNVMTFTKEIADETKMLGLNAAIEAARVGEAGRGFGVVAEEIRKLSEESKKTVAQIRELTTQIEQSMNATMDKSQSTLAGVEEMAAATEEVNATLEEMTSMANKLSNMAASL